MPRSKGATVELAGEELFRLVNWISFRVFHEDYVYRSPVQTARLILVNYRCYVIDATNVIGASSMQGLQHDSAALRADPVALTSFHDKSSY